MTPANIYALSIALTVILGLSIFFGSCVAAGPGNWDTGRGGN